MKVEKGEVSNEIDSWFLVTSEGKCVALVGGLKSAKKVYSGGDGPLDKFETFESAFLEFKKRWKNVPKSNRGQQTGIDESWQFILTKDNLVAIVRGYSEGNKILSNYLAEGFARMVNARTYTNLITEIKALRENKWPHKGILNSKYLVKPKAKK